MNVACRSLHCIQLNCGLYIAALPCSNQIAPELLVGPGFSGRAGLGRGSDLSLSKCFGPISGLHTTLLQHSQERCFFVTYIRSVHSGDFCESSDCDLSSANSTCKHSCVLSVSARIGLSHTRFLEGAASRKFACHGGASNCAIPGLF